MTLKRAARGRPAYADSHLAEHLYDVAAVAEWLPTRQQQTIALQLFWQGIGERPDVMRVPSLVYVEAPQPAGQTWHEHVAQNLVLIADTTEIPADYASTDTTNPLECIEAAKILDLWLKHRDTVPYDGRIDGAANSFKRDVEAAKRRLQRIARTTRRPLRIRRSNGEQEHTVVGVLGTRPDRFPHNWAALGEWLLREATNPTPSHYEGPCYVVAPVTDDVR